MHVFVHPDLPNTAGTDVDVVAFLEVVRDLNLSQVRVIQRKLDNRLDGFLVGTIAMDVIFADLSLKCLNASFLDQPTVTVDRVT